MVLIIGVIPGASISIPGSSRMVIADGTGAASSTVIQQPSSQTLVEVHAGEAPSMQWQVQGTNDVSEFLRKTNAERMHLEQQLGREEETAVHKLLKEQVRIEDNEETECCFGFVNILQDFLSPFFLALGPLREALDSDWTSALLSYYGGNLTIIRSRWVGADNSHTKPVLRNFYWPIYF